jgi:8-oxo-dGTP pyrophosphatase MutT (NUDIX family)
MGGISHVVGMDRHEVNGYRRASTVCLVRDAPALEILMVQRPHTSRFMPGTWVFPGGAVDDADAAPPECFTASDAWRTAALREMAEEVGLWITADGVVERAPDGHAFDRAGTLGLRLDGDALVYFANWITPEVFPLRFDTRFYLAVAPDSVTGSVDGDELVDLAWVSPRTALVREEEESWDVAFPTRKVLEMLSSFPTAAAALSTVALIETVEPIQPRLFVSDEEARIVLPDEELYDLIEEDQEDPEILSRLAAVIARGGHLPAEFRSRS